MQNDLVSIIIATYNSEKILPKVLEALRAQSYPQDCMEILLVDGGSTDGTKALVDKFDCILLNNPKTEPVHAKLLGIQHAKGKYAIFVDHDEVFENRDSILIRVQAMQKHPECKAAFLSGYKRPPHYPALNQYISDYGDPFSLFIYNCPKDWKFYGKWLKKHYRVVKEHKDYTLISFADMKRMPLIELVCAGTMIDLSYFKKETKAATDSSELVHLFYVMLNKGKTTVVVSKKDPLLHYSVDSLKAYFPKLKWRICNNIHYQEKGEKGFSGRLQYQSSLQFKKYLFVPYAIFFPISFIHGCYLALQRKNAVYLLHSVFCLYVVFQIIWQMCLKMLGIVPAFRSYDGKKKIER